MKLSTATAALAGTFMASTTLHTAFAFRTISSTRVNPKTSLDDINTQARHATFFSPRKATFDSRLFQQSTSDNDKYNHSINDNDIDGQRRRQLLFSMLYGGTATLMGGPEEATAATATADTVLEPSATATSIPPPVSTGILRPPKDDRDYLAYTLDNGLRVLLCSDPDSNEAAAAMDVHVGACSDPVEVPGMAHFCGKPMTGPVLYIS